jgi:hypothetical protein
MPHQAPRGQGQPMMMAGGYPQQMQAMQGAQMQRGRGQQDNSKQQQQREDVAGPPPGFEQGNGKQRSYCSRLACWLVIHACHPQHGMVPAWYLLARITCLQHAGCLCAVQVHLLQQLAATNACLVMCHILLSSPS